VAAVAATSPANLDLDDPMGRVAAAIVALDVQVTRRLGDATTLARLACLLRDAGFAAVEAVGALGRVTSAAVAGAEEVGTRAPALVSTARAAARLGAEVRSGLERFRLDLAATQAALSGLTTQLATTALHAELTSATAAIAWPPNDPGPESVPAASAAELARVVASDLDALIAELAATRDALIQARTGAQNCADQLKRMHAFIEGWRVQVPQWHVTDQIGKQLGLIDARQRLVGDHITALRQVAQTAGEAIELCSAAGLLEPMNAIGRATADTRGPRGRHAVASAPDQEATAAGEPPRPVSTYDAFAATPNRGDTP
jgi:hypothetical protein